MRVGVGSGNPVKEAATRRAVTSERDTFGADAVVEREPVPSGVSEQPRGHAETREGAITRAERAHAAGYDLGVGIEGGVAGAFGGETDGHLYLIMWAAVTDGGRLGVGSGPSFTLPGVIADRVRAGAELGPVMDDVLDEEEVARGRGAAGAVTGGRVDRTEALAAAVAGALGPFVTDLYD